MSNEGKQPHFTELVWESVEQNVAIPPRNSAEEAPPQKSSTNRIKSTSDDTVQLKLWDIETTQEPVTTTEGQFVLRAKELVQRSETVAALFVPFKSYWPTYGHMTGAQSNWYFYWRTEVRQGRFHKTDLSYIFLHVYELINGVGWEEPTDGYRQLCQLWEAYRDKYKRLDQYLGGWIADFSFVHKLDVPLSVIVARSRGLAGDLAELELMRCLSSAPEQLSFAVLTAMSDYDISKSKFYMGEGKEAAELYIPQVIALIDAYVTRKHGSNLLEMFPPAPPVLRERFLFRSAVYDISLYGYSVLVPVVRISKSVPLRSLITRLFRLTENKLRELLGYRGRLKGINVDDDMSSLVTRFLQREFHKLKQEEAGPVVVIDQGKLERLQTDSEIVRTLLTVNDKDIISETDESAVSSTASDAPITDLEEEPHDKEPVFEPVAETDPASTPAGAVTEWEQFTAALSPLQREALLTLKSDNGLMTIQQLAAESGTMPELLIDEINELAMDNLGDLLIDGEEIAEEFVPMLVYIKR
ncbi:TerB N-terminal domain-containing protein [Paenibacillus sp. 19GGS1-52]|uniref:TerB N-terminal domain-containing protein n=1 Tax=Paenibacillus sp. 19GGS1-52 TaxID=2758563 RepID=UPI001EFA984E|nr:TerB N-terminal domain-containing protein [Paenibacillus sp. 19GGS1-52]ULO04675.1 TerB N-terminal domain-containing protein [Paenibacillus sp. 19GGS1-52]